MYRARYLRFSFLILVAFLFVACGGGEQQTGGKSGVDKGTAAKQVEAGAYKPQRVAEPCGNDCPYEGDTVTVSGLSGTVEALSGDPQRPGGLGVRSAPVSADPHRAPRSPRAARAAARPGRRCPATCRASTARP
jgi:hypothetical protein